MIFFPYFCHKNHHFMNKIFQFFTFFLLLWAMSSCDFLYYIPMQLENSTTNIVEIPIDTNKVQMEITYNDIAHGCEIYLNVPNDCNINEDSMIVRFNNDNLKAGKIETNKFVENNYTKKNLKISPSHRIFFYINRENRVNRDSNLKMYLITSGMLVKDGKSLIDDTIKVDFRPGRDTGYYFNQDFIFPHYR